MLERFFQGNYGFLGQSDRNRLQGFYSLQGDWSLETWGESPVLRQDGSKWVDGLSSGVASLAGKLMGKRYQEFLDCIEAYAYFPLAVVRDVQARDADLQVEVLPLAGSIDRAGGLAFGLKNSATTSPSASTPWRTTPCFSSSWTTAGWSAPRPSCRWWQAAGPAWKCRCAGTGSPAAWMANRFLSTMPPSRWAGTWGCGPGRTR